MLYCPMETFPYQIVCGLSQAVLYVLKQVIHMFQPDGEADGGVGHIHLLALPIGEVSENGAGGMNGQRPVVKQVGCTAYKPQWLFQKYHTRGIVRPAKGAYLCKKI